ncbi:hypothetical protein GEV33_007162 [Tenebrio molitor]|uniref:phosphatidylinositol 3-kinase n=1 Tax=Tenebrio molitor TaxID=7067 RepID=A0A8J6HJ68_TENMO|nr:hypothetical protein GEV33_007162 [Tenebrio molitor]
MAVERLLEKKLPRTLLKDWPKLPPEKALELLDYAYPDQGVRSFAVECLGNVSDEDLLLYLLQLVQAIKHEVYLECDLVKFLIKRALNNQKIGHYLFWHLKSELQVASVSIRFGLILEAYCRGSQEHMPALLKQLEFLDKLKNSREHVKNKSKEKAKLNLKDYLTESHIDETVQSIRSPLDPSHRCSKIKLDKCRIMDSKMRPLWIVLENNDTCGEDVYIIFKDGDDLRQDMLTLQMLKIMDRLWKREGLDLRMNPYNCISLADRAGMIEVVLNAETIANIQKDKGVFSATSAFRKGSILAWLKDYNTTEAALNKAITEFTLSCAGYCVATYVLGIADRHSDNIMVKKSGQLFHIDFGHILGHFKEKFGIKRERVPFVLTHDFEYVINKGQKSALEFKIFQEYCEKAFLILRKHVSGVAYPCELLAILGSSGAGKTTLLNALTFQSPSSIAVSGIRCVNGVPVAPKTLTSQSAYVQQDDLFIGNLTVKEHLVFQALLRMDRHISYTQRMRRVEEVILEFGLTKCQNTQIGILAEVLTNPKLMFCDEPTSGLDSFMAFTVIQVLKSMAMAGRTVVCTIHQPSSELYSLFDKLLLMSEGRTAFLGSPEEADIFFKQLEAPCPKNYNPADYFIQLLAIIPEKEESSRQAVNMICDKFERSTIGVKLALEAGSTVIYLPCPNCSISVNLSLVGYR